MKAKVIQIGNSKGIRLPKSLLEETGIDGEVLLKASKDSIVIRRVRNIRQGWSEVFRQMSDLEDDRMLEMPESSSWDEAEWEWK